VASCDGPRGCILGDGGEAPRCDARIARAGGPCAATLGSHAIAPAAGSRSGLPVRSVASACSPERDAELACIGSVWTSYARCRGGDGCTLVAGGVVCDDSVAEVGDPCHSTRDGCSTDGRALRCEAGRYATYATCSGPKGCKPRPHEERVDCDNSVAQLGDYCWGSGVHACTPDGKELLRCGAAKKEICGYDPSCPVVCKTQDLMAPERRCAHRCRVTDTYSECS
jgi:hypothetical protein